MTTLRTFLILLLFALPSTAALPTKAIKKFQDEAPALLDLQITKVTKTPLKLKKTHVFQIEVEAIVLRHHRGTKKFSKGDQISISYRVPNMEKSPQAGDWAAVVKKDVKYKAYLKPKDAEQNLYRPAAFSGSFVMLRRIPQG